MPDLLSTEELAGYLGLTARHVRRLADAGIVHRATDENGNELQGRFEAKPSITGYIDYLRKRTDPGEAEYQRARTRRQIALATIEERRAARASGELVPRKEVENYMAGLILAARARLLSIPSSSARVLAGETEPVKVHKMLEDAIRRALIELARFDPDNMTETALRYGADLDLAEARKPNQNGESNGEESEIEELN